VEEAQLPLIWSVLLRRLAVVGGVLPEQLNRKPLNTLTFEMVIDLSSVAEHGSNGEEREKISVFAELRRDRKKQKAKSKSESAAFNHFNDLRPIERSHCVTLITCTICQNHQIAMW
jgi:hypothetical protein